MYYPTWYFFILFGFLHNHFTLLEEPKIVLEIRKHSTITRIFNSFQIKWGMLF